MHATRKMFEVSIEQIIVASGYIGILLLMIANGAVSFPSSQILYIITGYFIFTGDLALALVLLFGTLGNTIGCIILYELARSKGLAFITRFKLFPEHVIRKTQIAFQKRGAWFVFVGKLIPALKVFVPIPAGIARMHRGLYATLIAISSAIWAVPFIAVGYYFGKSADVFGSYSVIIIIFTLVILGLFYRYLNSDAVVREVEGLPETPEAPEQTRR